MSAQTIFRVAYRHKPYSQLGNAMLQDERLSPEATHILVFVLSLPITWRFNLQWVAGRRRMGRDRAQRAVRELQLLGYCQRRRAREEDGRLGGYEYVFTDEPQHLVGPQPEDQAVVDLATAWKPQPGEPAPVDQAAYKGKHQSRKQTDKKKDAHTREGTDAQVLPFSSTTLQELYSLGCDLDSLIKRYQARTKGRRIKDPSAYLLKMGREEVAKAAGVTAEEVKACSARNRGERQTNLAIVGGAYSAPDPIKLARARRTRGAIVEQVLASMRGRTFPTQAAADRVFDQELANAALRARQPVTEAAE